MKLKVTEVVIELEIQAVTCPGVWLCSNGKVTLHLYMLGSCTQTSPVNPVFPLLYHEKFTFKRTFGKVLKLSDLQKVLGKEFIYMELVQWEDCECPNVLATFKTSVSELLYPFPHSDCIMAGVDVDLLMEATKDFPGIISPKVEICTKTTIGEVLKTFTKKSQDTIVVNPKVISTKCIPKRTVPIRQRRVCHSYGYHKSRAARMSPEIAKANKVNNPVTVNIKQRKRECSSSPRDKIDWPVRKDETDAGNDIIQKIKNCSDKSELKCLCHIRNRDALCKLCTKYKYYFNNSCCACLKDSKCQKTKREKQETYNCDKEAEYDPKQVNKGDTYRSSAYYSNLMKDKIKDSSPLSSGRSSLAMQIHNRLEKTLGNGSCTCCLTNRCKQTKDKSGEEASCKESCNKRFYKSLEDFYKELYKRAHHKSKIERCTVVL